MNISLPLLQIVKERIVFVGISLLLNTSEPKSKVKLELYLRKRSDSGFAVPLLASRNTLTISTLHVPQDCRLAGLLHRTVPAFYTCHARPPAK
jgi:hypothetical protein